MYFEARYYDPLSGRFISPDPLFGEQMDKCLSSVIECNLYQYTGNNPVNAADHDGQAFNFIAKFVVDVGVNVAFNYVTTGNLNVASALKESAEGILDPSKTVRKVAKLAKALKKGRNKPSDAKKPGSCCFVAGTQVLTKDGYKNIEDVQLGEKLWAKNTDTGEQDWKPVTRIFVEPNRDIYEINLISSDGFEQKIQATDDHPFYVVGYGWKTTIDLKGGDQIETDGYDAMSVVSVIDENRQDLTYNFTVADFHTYYVTKRNLLVHNCNLSDRPSRRSEFRKAKEAAGIPKSAQYHKHKYVYDTENRTVYSFKVDGKNKYVILHENDKGFDGSKPRGKHFHAADDKKGDPNEKGRYNQYKGHYLENKDGFK